MNHYLAIVYRASLPDRGRYLIAYSITIYTYIPTYFSCLLVTLVFLKDPMHFDLGNKWAKIIYWHWGWKSVLAATVVEVVVEVIAVLATFFPLVESWSRLE